MAAHIALNTPPKFTTNYKNSLAKHAHVDNSVSIDECWSTLNSNSFVDPIAPCLCHTENFMFQDIY